MRRLLWTLGLLVIAVIGLGVGFWAYTTDNTPLNLADTSAILTAEETDTVVSDTIADTPSGTPPRDILVMSDAAGDWDLVLIRADGSTENLTADNSGAQDIFGAYLISGDTLNWLSNRADDTELGSITANADGTDKQALGIAGVIFDYLRQGKVDWDPSWSPDGTVLGWSSIRDANLEIYTVPLADTGLLDIDGATRHTNNLVFDWYGSWSPDGTRIVYNNNAGGNRNIYLLDLATSESVQITEHPANDFHGFWGFGTDNRETIYFVSERETLVATGTLDLFQWDGTETGAVAAVPDDVRFSADPVWSPGGTHVAFMSNEGESGNWQIYVAQADGTNRRRITPDDGNYMFAVWVP